MKIVVFLLKKIKKEILFFIVFLFILFTLPFGVLLAQSMQSTTYKITSDSINAGGQTSTSSIYTIGDTLGEVGTGDSNSTNYYIHAGFWQMQESYIAITSPADLALNNMGGISGGASEGTVAWTVTTDNAAGYTMDIKTNTTPALKSASDSFADYTPAGADPDYNFSISSSASAFGFSPEGSDTNARFKDNGSSCNIGTGEVSAKCWDGLSTIAKIIAGKTSSNHPGGSTVTTRFRAESGASHIQTSGSYSASITVTALVL